MKILPLLVAVAAAGPASADPPAARLTLNTTNHPVLGNIHREDQRLDALLSTDARLEVIAAGFEWSEGPVWIAAQGDQPGHLLFSEIPSNTVRKWTEGRGLEIFLPVSGYTGPGTYGGEPGSNGLALDREGHLLSCEHGDRRLSLLTRGGGKVTLADRFEGRRFNSPNDLCVKSNGDIYFTDPPYGLPERENDPRRELDFFGVYRFSPASGQVTLLTREMTRPNGIAFSPDEKTLYVAQSDPSAAIWKAFPVKEDGTLGESRLLADATGMVRQGIKGLPDGLKVDRDGNLWATGPGGVHIMAPDGTLLGRIETGEATSNCAFGGEDGSTLFVTADMYVCRIRTLTTAANAAR